METEVVGTIDMTPSWEGILNSLLLIYTDSMSSADRQYAHGELARMGRLADAFVKTRDSLNETINAIQGNREGTDYQKGLLEGLEIAMAQVVKAQGG